MSAVSDIVAEMRGEYLADCARRLGDLRGLLEHATIDDAAQMHEVEKQAHAIKGSAFSFGLPEMSLLCGVWEGEMKQVRLGSRDAPLDTAPWRHFCAMFGAMVERADVKRKPGDSALIWSPFETSRDALMGQAEARFSAIQVATTDAGALRVLAYTPVSAIVATGEADSELNASARNNLLIAAAGGSGASLLIKNGDGDDVQELIDRGAQPL